jgi:WD40 repeat protein
MSRKILAVCTVILLLTGCAATTDATVTKAPLTPTPICAAPDYAQAATQGTFSPDQRFVAVGSNAGAAIYNAQTKSMVGCLSNTSGPQPKFAFSADSKYLVVAQYAGYPIKVWQLEPDLQLIFQTTSSLSTGDIVFSHDSLLLAIAASDGGGSDYHTGTLKIWDIGTRKLIKQFDRLYKIVGFTPDNSQIEVDFCATNVLVCSGQVKGTVRLSV